MYLGICVCTYAYIHVTIINLKKESKLKEIMEGYYGKVWRDEKERGNDVIRL